MLISVHMPVRLAICLQIGVKTRWVRRSRCRGWGSAGDGVDVCWMHLPKHRSTYRMGPPLRGRAQASSADTSAMGRHLRDCERGEEGRVGG